MAHALGSVWRQWLPYVAARVGLALLQALPWSTARGVGRVLGDLAYAFDRRRRKITAVANLQEAFPALSEAEAKRILRGVYRHFAEAVVDGTNFARFAAHRDAADLFDSVGFERLREVPGGPGVVFVTGHFGHWEVLGIASPRLGSPVWSVARDSSNPFLARYVQRLRESTGQRTLPKGDTWRQVIRLVKQGENIALLIDQDARRNGIFVDFFGRPASTAPSAGRLAVYTGAPVAFAYARRIPGRNRFRLVLKDLILPQADRPPEEEVHRITQRLTADLEEEVRRAPQEWLWLHRRWKTQPGTYEPVRKAVILVGPAGGCTDRGEAPPAGPREGDAQAGGPSLGQVLDRLLRVGLRRICCVVPPGSGVMEERIKRMGEAAGAKVECVVQAGAPGAAAAVLAAERFVGDDCFVLDSGNRPCPPEVLRRLAAKTGRTCWVAAADASGLARNGGAAAVAADGFAVLRISKAGHLRDIVQAPPRPRRYLRDSRLWVSLGLYRLTPEVFQACRSAKPKRGRGTPELTAVIGEMLASQRARFQVLFCEGNETDADQQLSDGQQGPNEEI